MLSAEIPTCSTIVESDMSTSSNTSTFSNLRVSSISWADAKDDDDTSQIVTPPVSPAVPNASSTPSFSLDNIVLPTYVPVSAPIQSVVPAWSGSLPVTISGPLSSSIPVVTDESSSSSTIKSESVSKFITSDIRLTDTDGDIRLFHYVHCDDTSGDDVKACRGIIRDGDDVVCKTFGYTPEISCSDVDLVKSQIHSFSGCKVYDAEEGATVRFWFDFKGKKWCLSTHRKIDACHSRWGNPNAQSFGDMFQDALQWECLSGEMKGKFSGKNRAAILKEYTDSLDQNKTYVFLVRNSHENRIVCDATDHPQAYFIGSFDRSTHLLLEGNDSGFPTPKTHDFADVDALLEFTSNVDSRKKQGLIVYLPNQKQIKIMNQTYLDFFGARGNEPSIKYRYLQVRKDQNMVSMLYTLYPEHIPTFEMYENVLTDVSRKIHRAYVSRFIQRQFVSLPQPEFFVLQACHGWHVQDRSYNKISLEKVTNMVDSQSPTSLNKLIKPYIVRPNGQTDRQTQE